MNVKAGCIDLSSTFTFTLICCTSVVNIYYICKKTATEIRHRYIVITPFQLWYIVGKTLIGWSQMNYETDILYVILYFLTIPELPPLKLFAYSWQSWCFATCRHNKCSMNDVE